MLQQMESFLDLLKKILEDLDLVKISNTPKKILDKFLIKRGRGQGHQSGKLLFLVKKVLVPFW